MTESEWLRSDDPRRMLAVLAVLDMREETEGSAAPKAWKVSDRKFRLFACACCRAVWDRFSGPCRQAVETAERYADGGLPFSVLNEARRQSGAEDNGWVWCATNGDIGVGLRQTLYHAVQVPPPSHAHPTPSPGEMAAILRDIVGDRFRPIELPSGSERKIPCPTCGSDGLMPWRKKSLPSVQLSRCLKCFAEGPLWSDVIVRDPSPWLTPQVLSLAQAAYEERAERLGADEQYEAFTTSIRTTNYRCLLCGYIATGKIRENHRRFCKGDGMLDPFRLALLADALEEAGCSCVDCRTCGGAGVITQDHPFGDTWASETLGCPHCEGGGREQHPLLTHLRSPGPHYRGCHVVDTLLGKA